MIAAPIQGFPSHSPILRVMAFIDGEFLESNLRKDWGSDVKVNYAVFLESLKQYLPRVGDERYHIIRIYYYDAINVNKATPTEQEEKHRIINDTNYFELRLGRIKDDGAGKPRQKGVDTLIAIDMVTKAYQGHYDVAVLLAGDDDFLDVVKAVKNAGRQVVGYYFEKLTSRELKNSFDMKRAIDTNFATQIRTPQRPTRADGKT